MALDMNYDPPKHLNLLTTLDEAGQSEYPGLVALAYFPVTSVEERMAVAMKAYQSLVIRLLVRRPLRTRNGCDRQIDGNLCCESGHWTIQFRAEEMEKERAHRRPRVYRVIFPEDLVSQLEEFLAVWRPMLPGRDLAELFTTLAGRPFSGLALNNGVRKTIYAHTGARPTFVRSVLSGLPNFLSRPETLRRNKGVGSNS